MATLKNNQKLLYISVSLFILAILLGLTSRFGLLREVDLATTAFIQRVQPQWLLFIMLVLSLLDGFNASVATIITIYLFRVKRNRTAMFIFLTLITWLIIRVLKTSYNVACPTIHEAHIYTLLPPISSYIDTAEFSLPSFLAGRICYPSGHVYSYVVIWGILMYLQHRIWDSPIIKKFVVIFGLISIILIGFSRISVGAHWLSDTVGGYLFGFSWLTLLIYYDRKYPETSARPIKDATISVKKPKKAPKV